MNATLTAQVPARFLMVGDVIQVNEDPDALMVFTGPSGRVRVITEPEITYAFGYVPCVIVTVKNEFGGITGFVIDASERVTNHGREV